MSSLGGRLRKVATNESLDHTGSKFCLISIWWLQRLIHKKCQFRKKNTVLLIEKFPSLLLSTNAIMLQHLIMPFALYYLSNGCLMEVKNKRKCQTFSSEVVTIAYKRWLLTRGSKYSNLTWKFLVFWKTDCCGEVVATGGLTRGSKYSDLTWKLLIFWKTGCWGKVVAIRGLTA